MMKEEDKERIYNEHEAIKFQVNHAFNKGKIGEFNKGIEAARNLLWKYRYSQGYCIAEVVEELEKLKKPI